MTTNKTDEHPELDWRTDHGDDAWDVTPNLVTFLPIAATAETDHLRWELVVDVVDDRLACTNLEVKRLDHGPAITSELLRTFPVKRELHRIVSRAGLAAHDPLPNDKRPAELLANGPTDDALRYVVDVYQLAYACGLNPTKAVTERGIARSTAERWIRKAREKGML